MATLEGLQQAPLPQLPAEVFAARVADNLEEPGREGPALAQPRSPSTIFTKAAWQTSSTLEEGTPWERTRAATGPW